MAYRYAGPRQAAAYTYAPAAADALPGTRSQVHGGPRQPGAYQYGGGGLGRPGALIRAGTASGTHGPGYLFNDLSAADDASEVRGLVITPPSAGSFFAYEDGSFTLAGAPNGNYSFVYRLLVDGLDLGTATASISIGP